MTAPPLDLRSDTVTRPDREMRRAMAAAEVGDDVYREDPTVARLEELGADWVGTEAALFTPTGTMGNQIALHLHGRPGGEVVAEADCHMFRFEMGAMAALSGLIARPVPGRRGRLDPVAFEAAINPDLDYLARTEVLAVENTHNMAGGTVTPRSHLERLLEVARRRDLPIHLDGARLFNAAVALEVRPAELAAGFDSVMVSLSKGLGAPIGSLLCGDRDLIDEARRVRKMFGGGMRQVGIVAAAGVVALERGIEHLLEDHANARLLAEAVGSLAGVAVDLDTVETNIVMARTDDSGELLERLRGAGILAIGLGPETVRFVTHRDVPRAALEAALERL